MTIDIDALAQEIRRVDGDYPLNARALAEKLAPFIETMTNEDKNFCAENPAPKTHKTGLMTIEEYVDGYSWRGDEGDYTPKDHEKAMLIDALHGAVGEVFPVSSVRRNVDVSEMKRLIEEGRVFQDTDPEARFIADAVHACPHCGGSGHKDDVPPSPETRLDVKDHTKLDGPELWELTFGILEGDVPEQMTDEVFAKMAEAINNVFVDPLQLAGKFPSPETHVQGIDWPVGEAEVVLYDPRRDPIPKREPYKIIDASLWFMGKAELGERLYTKEQVEAIVSSALNNTAPHNQAADLTNEQREITLLRIIEAMGGETDSSESKHSWLNWFCSDEIHNVQEDTFNRCNDKGWLSTSHNSDWDTSTTTLTKAGRAALATAPEATDA